MRMHDKYFFTYLPIHLVFKQGGGYSFQFVDPDGTGAFIMNIVRELIKE
jgi:hypothetical protein